jgi:hypothetical protein
VTNGNNLLFPKRPRQHIASPIIDVGKESDILERDLGVCVCCGGAKEEERKGRIY